MKIKAISDGEDIDVRLFYPGMSSEGELLLFWSPAQGLQYGVLDLDAFEEVGVECPFLLPNDDGLLDWKGGD